MNKLKISISIIIILFSTSLFSQVIEKNEIDTLKCSHLSDSTFLKFDLKEVLVEKNLPNMINKFDRKVFPISESKKAAARTVIDLLRLLPGVVVDDNGNIRFKGTEASIYIDEQPMDKIYSRIEMIPVERIEKIELIDPAMRIGGDGHGGMINIKLKTERTSGLSGMASANIGTYQFNGIDNSRGFFNLNYKKDKIIFFLNSSIDHSDQSEEADILSNVELPDFSSNQSSLSTGHIEKTGFYNYLGANYNPSENTKIYFSVHFLRSMYQDNSQKKFTETNQDNESIFNQYINNNDVKDKQIDAGFYTSYWHKIDTLDSYITLSGSSYIFNGYSDSNPEYHFLNMNSKPVDSLYYYSNERDFYSQMFYFNFFFNKSITKESRWNLSYNLMIDKTDSLYNKHYVFNKLDFPQSQMNKNINQSHILSFRIGTKINSWKFDVGSSIKAEYIDADFLRYNTDDRDTTLLEKKLYFKILPSLTIAYSWNNVSDIKLSLSKTSESPYFLQLPNFIDKTDLYNWSSGNPDLKPVDYYSIYLGYTHNKEDWNASAEVFFNYSDNEIKNISIPVSSLITLSKPENIALKSNTGIDISFWYEINNKLNFSISTSIFHSFYDLKTLSEIAEQLKSELSDVTRRQFSYYIKYNMEYKIKDFYFMFYVNYYAKKLTYNGYDKPSMYSSVSLSKRLLNNRLMVALSVSNIFKSIFEHGSYSNDFGIVNDKKLYGSNYDCFFNLSFQYKFNQGDRGTKDFM